MRDFQWTSPTEFFFGRGAQDKIGAWAEREGLSRALLVFGQGHAVRSGLIAQVEASLEAAGIAVEELGGVRPNPKVELVYEGIGIAREKGCDLVVGVGGGSALDTAKAIAVGTLYEGDIWDIYGGPDPAPTPSFPPCRSPRCSPSRQPAPRPRTRASSPTTPSASRWAPTATSSAPRRPS